MAAKTGVQADRIRRDSAGFALPTILISSIVMLIVLLVSVTATASVRTALKSQYYEQLAQAAGEAGVAYAEACLNANGGVPQWSNASPLKPNTDCTGTELVACPTTSTNPLCSVARNDNIRSSFSIGLPPVVAPSALVVAGGGSGGGSTGGGGGAGGVVYSTGTAVAVGAYPVVVGAGGPSPGNELPGISGSDSSFNGIVAKGGGGGGYSTASVAGAAGQDGGSGGGGQTYYSSFGPGKGISGQGNNGGPLSGVASTTGGGGAGGGGANIGSANNGGAGGVGISNSITGAAVFYGGGGGGGGSAIAGAGGNGGGGNGGVSEAQAASGTANTGGGGGGGWGYASGNGGAGGSGVVIIRYPTGSITASGGTVTTVGSDTVHRFTASGTFTVSAISNTLETIPNTGFVELLRDSNSAVWRTYQQKSAPSSAVPDLCSGEAKSIYGWNNAVITADTGAAFPVAAAKIIGISASAVNPGPIYFRKDFSVTTAGTYDFRAMAANGVSFYVDGTLAITTGSFSTVGSASINLSAGCHTITAVVTNVNIAGGIASLRASVTLQGTTAPTIVTDTSWRVSAGNTVHYSDPNFFASPGKWTVVRDVNESNAVLGTWGSTSGDPDSREISTTHNNSGGTYPTNSSAFFRDGRKIVVDDNTDVKVTVRCDDACMVYRNGEVVLFGVHAEARSVSLTLTAGTHMFGVGLSNGAGPAGFSLAVVRSDGVVMTRSDDRWVAADFWNSTIQNYYSFDSTFVPNPNNIPASPTASVLVVGGGGGGGRNGGGGGGAGGVIINDAYALSVGSTAVTIGAGGAGATANSLPGTSGNNTVFGSLTAIGGGGGASRDGGVGGQTGGSGGGGGGATVSPRHLGGAGTAGQGSNGANGTTPDPGCGASGGGGGGAGGDGTPGVASAGGNAGPGIISYITGLPVGYGGGGAGGPTCPGTYGRSNAGGGSGNGTAGTANTGGGGAGGYTVAGTGGSGVVIISYRTGTVVATGGTITTAGGYTIHRFTTSGTFTVTSIP